MRKVSGLPVDSSVGFLSFLFVTMNAPQMQFLLEWSGKLLPGCSNTDTQFLALN